MDSPKGATIKAARSIVPSCDFDSLKDFTNLIKQVDKIEGIGAYKIGFELGLAHGLPAVVAAARKYTKKPIIYDHQKAGTDVPFTGEKFAKVCAKAGIDSVIFFPQAGPETERAWIEAARKEKLKIIVGGEMTHKGYLEGEGGFLKASAPEEMYKTAIQNGVFEFVVPGNKPEKIAHYKKFFEGMGVKPVLYSPGLISQGGDITDSARAAGEFWHAIVGRALYEAPDMKKAALEMCAKLLKGN